MIRTAMRYVAVFLLSLTATARSAEIDAYYGKWLGKIVMPNGPTFSTGIDIFQRADGSAGASMASPDQGVFSIPADYVALTATDATIKIAMLNIEWRLQPRSDLLAGEVHQGKLTLPIELKRVATFGEPQRFQTPKSTSAYKSENFVATARDGAMLAGTLTEPLRGKAIAAVVLVHGSGPVDRDEFTAGHRPFAVLADFLSRRNIAVYRYDKRGVMRSTGSFAAATTDSLAEDALAAVRAVKHRTGLRTVGILGHSEGGLIAAMLAAQYPGEISFVISLAGPGLTGRELMALQDRVGYERRGLAAAEIDMLDSYGQRFYDIVIDNAVPEMRLESLKQLIDSLSPTERSLVQKHAMRGSLSLQQASSPTLRSILMSDAPSHWRQVKCPALALNGALDVQVPAKENLAAIRAALDSARNHRARIESIPNLNHLFQTATTGLEEEYARLDETMAPLVLDKIAGFIGQQR